MFEAPALVSITVLVGLIIVALLIWSRLQGGGNPEGDFEKRVAAMQSGHLTGSQGAQVGPAGEGPALPTVSSLSTSSVPGQGGSMLAHLSSVFAPAQKTPRVEVPDIDDPVFGSIEYWDDGQGGIWERIGLPQFGLEDAHLSIAAGPEGPTSAQRAYFSSLVHQHADVFQRAKAIAGVYVAKKHDDRNPVQVDGVHIERQSDPGAMVSGSLALSGENSSYDSVYLVSNDGWRTFRVVEGDDE